MKKILSFTPCSLRKATKKLSNLTATLDAFLNGDHEAARAEWRGRYVSPVSCSNALKKRAKTLLYDKSVWIETHDGNVYLIKL